MTKKDYIKFSKLFNHYYALYQSGKGTQHPEYLLTGLMRNVTEIFADDTPNFDYDKFMSACLK